MVNKKFVFIRQYSLPFLFELPVIITEYPDSGFELKFWSVFSQGGYPSSWAYRGESWRWYARLVLHKWVIDVDVIKQIPTLAET